MQKTTVYLGLGGNEGQVLSSLKQALILLSHQKKIYHLKCSHFYRTAPHEVNSSLWFVNAVCSFQTDLSASAVFSLTQLIETQLNKVSKPKNASRPIDIDVLFYGNQIFNENQLQIPHARWKERLFVLVPLADLVTAVTICGVEETEHYVLQDLINPLIKQSSQEIYLLEKNPHLQ